MNAAEQIGVRIAAVHETEVRSALWTLWILAVHAAAGTIGSRHALYRWRICPLINRLCDPSERTPRQVRDGWLPPLPHSEPGVEAICWALRQVAFGDEAAALRYLGEAV